MARIVALPETHVAVLQLNPQSSGECVYWEGVWGVWAVWSVCELDTHIAVLQLSPVSVYVEGVCGMCGMCGYVEVCGSM